MTECRSIQMWRHTQAVKCMLKGDFSTYPALICPLCNGYQGLSGNGAIKKRYSERSKRRNMGRGEKGREERDRKVGGVGR